MATLTEDEHVTRAMLLGMYYHEGNGEPFYYKKDRDGTADAKTFIDAHSLEPMVDVLFNDNKIDWKGLRRRIRAKQDLGLAERSWLK